MVPFHFSGARFLETLCGTLVCFHFWHKNSSYGAPSIALLDYLLNFSALGASTKNMLRPSIFGFASITLISAHS